MNKVKKMHNLRKVTGNWTKNLQKLGAQQKTPHPEIRRNPRTSRMTKKKTVNQLATQFSWLVSIRDEILTKDISKQSEFRFVVSKQALAQKHQKMTGNLFYVSPIW